MKLTEKELWSALPPGCQRELQHMPVSCSWDDKTVCWLEQEMLINWKQLISIMLDLFNILFICNYSKWNLNNRIKKVLFLTFLNGFNSKNIYKKTRNTFYVKLFIIHLMKSTTLQNYFLQLIGEGVTPCMRGQRGSLSFCQTSGQYHCLHMAERTPTGKYITCLTEYVY